MPHQVVLNQYNNLAMLLHGFTGACEESIPPKKETMDVRPLPIMQKIIQKNLQKGEGFITLKSKKPLCPLVIPEGGFQDEIEESIARQARFSYDVDICDYEIQWDRENPYSRIKISALTRITMIII